MVSSSEDEGSGDWQPPKNGTEEESSVKQKIPQLRKKRPAATPRNRLVRVVLSSFCAYNNVSVLGSRFKIKDFYLSHAFDIQ